MPSKLLNVVKALLAQVSLMLKFTLPITLSLPLELPLPLNFCLLHLMIAHTFAAMLHIPVDLLLLLLTPLAPFMLSLCQFLLFSVLLLLLLLLPLLLSSLFFFLAVTTKLFLYLSPIHVEKLNFEVV
jgi:hypothetical protein